MQRTAQALEEHRAPLSVLAQKAHAPVASGEAEGGELVLRHVVVTRHEQLQHRGRPVVERGFGDVGLGPLLVGSTDGDPPRGLQVGHQRRELLEPTTRARRARLVAHHLGNVDHGQHPRAVALEASREFRRTAGPHPAPPSG